MVETRPYGAWESPLSASLLASASSAIGDVQVEPTTNTIYWVESRPKEKGRNVLVCKQLGSTDKATEVTPSEYSVRTRVHEYGDGSFSVKGQTVVFSNDHDFRLYKVSMDDPGRFFPVTPENKKLRFASAEIHPSGNYLVCVQEKHSESDSPDEVVNTLVYVRLDLPEGQFEIGELASGHDFYSTPRFNPSNLSQIAYIAWDHPNMVWDHTQLSLLTIEENAGKITKKEDRKLVGDEESIVQPRFSADGSLHFVSDKPGFWNLFEYDIQQSKPKLVLKEPLDLEFGVPEWTFGCSNYAHLLSDPSKIVATCANQGTSQLQFIDSKAQTMTELSTPYTVISKLHTLHSPSDKQDLVVFTGGSPSQEMELVVYSISQQKVLQKLTEKETPEDERIPESIISTPEAITFQSGNNQVAYGYYYPPKNDRFKAPEGELPPLLTLTHGGPTSQSYAYFNPKILYWTSRGFAVVDVNYSGSSGYGREFRQRLQGNWGLADIEDCCNAAKYLVDRGSVDSKRLSIAGGSAGGYTTLACLTFRPEVFSAGASHYGISDLELLAQDTHKFESRYMDRLIGPYPEAKQTYHDRSPIHYVNDIQNSLIFFQGLEDKVVPPNQAEFMVNALKKNKVPVAYVTFEGEQHGFRMSENIKRASEAQLWFLGQIFGFSPADTIEPVEIHNFTK
ncbi:alpha/beta-hydrolase [Basidiobolus meristosporus CBS 931.73]|uniref:Alpha/beta-hydrolase n=1 Tax=Basidiobolus meristosporus CBS 931.73 TaxID=1314790 RepID=A0A1Y1Z876_9FUNG|nr:alpha/beta-hydrolase [Basidiobolus meristosporus CBS 931.73]|eukprot:ORY06314.1 alpha/beta-hydrolase [Basidiobolus meristosporus CBS 931.73]